MADRPSHLPPGSLLGKHYVIEGLVRLAEGRMFYLANDGRPDQPTRRCWTCHHEDSPRTATACLKCNTPFRDRRFLISARWDRSLFDAYETYWLKGLEHPGLARPWDVFRTESAMFSVVPYNGEGLMLDEASPLSNKRILEVGQRVLGTVAFLRRHGVRLKWLTRANLLIHTDNAVSLFDIEVEECAASPVNGRSDELASFGEILRRYCNVDAEDLRAFFHLFEDGEGKRDGVEFGRGIEKSWPTWADVSHRPLLGGMSDVGLTRQLNEDNWGWLKLSDRASLYVVADGMGGHDSGEVASMLAVQVVCRETRRRENAEKPSLEQLETVVRDCFQAANNHIKETAESKGTDMGTTMVCILVVDGPQAGSKVGFLANVGDSRGYLLRDGALHQLSRDHSLVQKMVERGRITADEARHHPHSNILLRTVGTERDIEIDVFRVELKSGDKVMMCSDGLWGEVEDRDIENLMNNYADPRIASRELVRAAHHGGGKDNVTLVIVTIP
jgi:serine/threonine protein phosphatase PrpC